MDELRPLGFYIKRCHDVYVADCNEYLKQFNLTFSQMEALIFLVMEYRVGRVVCQKEFEVYFRLKHPTVVGILQRLKKKGFLSIQVNPEDRRGNLVYPTDKVTALVDTIIASKKKLDLRLTEGFTEEESAQLLGYMHRIYKNVNKNS